MKRNSTALLPGLLLIVLVPGSVLAIPPGATLDQHQDTSDTCSVYGNNWAQTFTVGITGQLTDVGLSLEMDGTGTANVSIQTLNSSFQPSGTPLATGSAQVTGSKSWVYFSLSVPVSVVAGQRYAIVPMTGGLVFSSCGMNTDLYAGGQVWYFDGSTWSNGGDSDYDLEFRTYVVPAAPALTLVKTSDKATYTAGDTVTYTYTLHNTGNVALTTFSVTDDKTTVNCTGAVSSLAAGASTTCTATYLTTTADGVAGSATNHATAHAVYGETTYDSNPDSVTVTVVPVPATAAPATAAPVTPAPATPAPATAAPATAAPVTPAPVTPAPTRAATPPPTSTGSGSSSNDSGAMMWFLPVGLIAFL